MRTSFRGTRNPTRSGSHREPDSHSQHRFASDPSLRIWVTVILANEQAGAFLRALPALNAETPRVLTGRGVFLLVFTNRQSARRRLVRPTGDRIELGEALRGLPVGIRPTAEDGVYVVRFCQHDLTQVDLRQPD